MQSQRFVVARSHMPRLSQETLTIIGASIALATLILASTAGVRGEIRVVRGEIQTVRDELRVEIRDVRAEARADRDALRAEARTDRDALRAEARADRETFQNQILRLTEQQGILGARLDGLRNPPATNR